MECHHNVPTHPTDPFNGAFHLAELFLSFFSFFLIQFSPALLLLVLVLPLCPFFRVFFKHHNYNYGGVPAHLQQQKREKNMSLNH